MFFRNEKAHFLQLFSNRHLIEMIYDYFPFIEVIKYSNITNTLYQLLNKHYSFKKLALNRDRIFITHSPSCIFQWSSLKNLNQIIKQSEILSFSHKEDYLICHFLKNIALTTIEFKELNKLSVNLIRKILINLSQIKHITHFYIDNSIDKINEAISDLIIKLPFISSITIINCDMVNEEDLNKFFLIFESKSIQRLTFYSSISSLNSKTVVEFIQKCLLTVQALFLASNFIDSNCIQFLKTLIMNGPMLNTLLLENNTIKAQAFEVRALILAYKGNSHLNIFQLNNNTLIDQAINFLNEYRMIYFENNSTFNSFSDPNKSKKKIVYKDKYKSAFTLNDIHKSFFCGKIRSLSNLIIELCSIPFSYIINDTSFHLIYDSVSDFDFKNSNAIFITKLTYSISLNRLIYLSNDMLLFLIHYQSITKLNINFNNVEDAKANYLLYYLNIKAKELNIQPNVVKLKIIQMNQQFTYKEFLLYLINPIIGLFPKLKQLTFDYSKIRKKHLNKVYNVLLQKDIKLSEIVLKNSVSLTKNQIEVLENKKIKVTIIN